MPHILLACRCEASIVVDAVIASRNIPPEGGGSCACGENHSRRFKNQNMGRFR